MNIQRLLAIALIASSVALVGCGGGGGGGSSKKSSNNTPATAAPVVQDDLASNPGDDDSQQPITQTPNEGELDELADNGDPSQPELLLPVDPVNTSDDLALLPDALQPGQIAANPEPATAALAAMGLAFLATRRYGRRQEA